MAPAIDASSPPAHRRALLATNLSISSWGLAHAFDAHSLRWRRVRNAGDGGDASLRCGESVEPFGDCPSNARLWTTDDLPWFGTPPREETFAASVVTSSSRPCSSVSNTVPTFKQPASGTTMPARDATTGCSDSISNPPATGAAKEAAPAAAAAQAREAAAEAAAPSERHHVAPFLVHDLMGMEQIRSISRLSSGQENCQDCRFFCCDRGPWLWNPQNLCRRLKQRLLDRKEKRGVTSLHIPVIENWHMGFLEAIASSCVDLQALYIQVIPKNGWCSVQGSDHLEPTELGWRRYPQLEEMKQLITGCPHLRSLHFSLGDNKYLTITEELSPLLSSLSHLSLPLFTLPPYLLPHLSSLRSLRLSLSANRHPFLLSGRPFQSLSLIYLLHLSLGSPASGISEPLPTDMFAGLGANLRSLTFRVHVQRGGMRGRRLQRGGRTNGGEHGGEEIRESERWSGEDEDEDGCGETVEDEWGREDDVMCWLPESVWELTELQQLTTNVGGGWHGTGLNALFPPLDLPLPPLSPCSCCSSVSSPSCSSSSPSASPLSTTTDCYSNQHQRRHQQCLSSLPHLTSLSLLSHRTFPPCLSSLSSLTRLSIPLTSPLLSRHTLSLLARCSNLAHLHVSGEGPSLPPFPPSIPSHVSGEDPTRPPFLPTPLATSPNRPPAAPHSPPPPSATARPTAPTTPHPTLYHSSASIRNVTLTGTAGAIPLAVWASLCPQLQTLKVQGSPHVLLQGLGGRWGEGWAEGWVEGRVEGSKGQGACGEGESACGEGKSGPERGGASRRAIECFFPYLEELVLCDVIHHGHGCSHPLESQWQMQQKQQQERQQQKQQQQQAHTLAFMGSLPKLTHLAIQNTPSRSQTHNPAPTLIPSLLPSLIFLRVHSPPRSALPILPKLRTLIVGSYPHSSRFLSSLSSLPRLSSLRVFHLSMHHYQSALSCPPSLKSVQICHSDVPLLPDSFHRFSSLTRLDLFQCAPLLALPPFLSSFSSLTHFSFDSGYNPVVVPVCLDRYLEGRSWAQEGEKGGSKGKGAEEGKLQSVSVMSEGERERRRQMGGEDEEEGWKWWDEDAEGVEEEKHEEVQMQQGEKVALTDPSKGASNSSTGKSSTVAEVLQSAPQLPAEVLQSASQLPAEVLQRVLLMLHHPRDQVRMRAVCREWLLCCRHHTSSLSLAFHPLLLCWLPLALLHPLSHPPPPFSSSSSSYNETPPLNEFPLSSSLWHPAHSPLWVIHSSRTTQALSLFPSSPPPFTLSPPTPASSLSSCFTHQLTSQQPISPIWFSSLPPPSSLAHTISLHPNLCSLFIPLVSTPNCPLLPSHVSSLLSAIAAQTGLSSLSMLLEDGFGDDCRWGYGREGLMELQQREREMEVRRWWVEANRTVEGGLRAVLRGCCYLKRLQLQGRGLTDWLKLPHSLFHSCPQLTALSLPLSRLPSSLLHLSHLTSLSLSLPRENMPLVFSRPAPFSHLRSLCSLSLHNQDPGYTGHSSSTDDSSRSSRRDGSSRRRRRDTESSSWSDVSEGLFLGLHSSLTALSLHLPIHAMPDSFSCLSSLRHLGTALSIPRLAEEDEEEGEEEEEEAEEEEEEGRRDDGGRSAEAEEEQEGYTAAVRMTDESLFPFHNLTSLSLSHYSYFPPLIRHLTGLTSLALPSLNLDYHKRASYAATCSVRQGLSCLTRLEELHIGCCSRSNYLLSACLPRLPRLRRCQLQCPDESVHITRFLANVAPYLEHLVLHADVRLYPSADLTRAGRTTGIGREWAAPDFPRLKVLQVVTKGVLAVDMFLLPALEHIACVGNLNINWQDDNQFSFSSHLRFLHLDCVKMGGYESDTHLTQLTSLTTLVLDRTNHDFLPCLSAFSSLRTLRLSLLIRGNLEPYFSYPPLLSTLQICLSDLPCLPTSLSRFTTLTRLDLLHWTSLQALPPFLSSFTSLRHLRVTSDGAKPKVPACLAGLLRNSDWYEHSSLSCRPLSEI